MAYIYDPAKRQYRTAAYPDLGTFRAKLKQFCKDHNLKPSQVTVTPYEGEGENCIQLSHIKAASDLQHQAEALKAASDVARRYELKELSCE